MNDTGDAVKHFWFIFLDPLQDVVIRTLKNRGDRIVLAVLVKALFIVDRGEFCTSIIPQDRVASRISISIDHPGAVTLPGDSNTNNVIPPGRVSVRQLLDQGGESLPGLVHISFACTIERVQHLQIGTD